MSGAQRTIAAVVAVLAVLVVVVVLLTGGGGPIDGGPEQSSTPETSATPTPSAEATGFATPSADGSAGAPSEGDVLAALEEIEAQVAAIRGLPPADIGPAELISREELEAELIEIFEADYPPEERERDNFTLRAFGLLGPDQDVGELQLELLTAQVVGFYDDEAERMVVVSDTGLDANAKLTYAHEYTHALQDAAFGLDSLETDAVGEDDRGLARVALIEGDATVTMLAWALQHMTPQELGEIGSGPIPDTADVPDWMMSQLIFPYLAGQEWVIALMAESGGTPLAPEYEAVDAAFADPPDSTAQIMHPELWFEGVEPTDVDAPDIAAALGPDWEEVDSSPVGEAMTGTILEHFGVPTNDAADAARGWAGDQYVIARGPNDEFALAWRSEFETEDDAAAFEAAYGTVIDALEVPALVTRDGSTVFVAHASNDDLLRRTDEAAR